jgi:hypothetical protein
MKSHLQPDDRISRQSTNDLPRGVQTSINQQSSNNFSNLILSHKDLNQSNLSTSISEKKNLLSEDKTPQTSNKKLSNMAFSRSGIQTREA